MKKTRRRVRAFSVLFSLVWGCASSVAPPGGEELEEPTEEFAEAEDGTSEAALKEEEPSDLVSTEKPLEQSQAAAAGGEVKKSPGAAGVEAEEEGSLVHGDKALLGESSLENLQELDAGESVGGLIQGAAGKPAGVGLPEMGSKLHYIVKPGETLGRISKKIFGTPGKWRTLAKMSSLANPNRIFPGDVIYYELSQKSLSFATKNENPAKISHMVKTGDTLGSLAKKIYGATHLWKLVWRMNPQIENPNQLKAGEKIYYESLTPVAGKSHFGMMQKNTYGEGKSRANIIENVGMKVSSSLSKA